MSDEFESTPYDGHHAVLSPGNDWRHGGIDGLVSYGNWAGPGNRMDHEPGFEQRMKEKGPGYDPYEDHSLIDNPKYKRIDGIDEAAFQHDHGYFKHLHEEQGNSMFGWDGMHNVREDDRQLAAATQKEMDTNGDKYSFGAKRYSEGLRGFFGGRVMAQDAVDFVGNKAGEAGRGISNFVQGAKNWNGVGDAVRGIGGGIMDAGRWGLNTAGQAIGGLAKGAWDIAKLGPVGWAGAALGGLNVAGAGALKLGTMAGQGIMNGASAVGRGISNVAGAAWDGAKAVGRGIGNAAGAAWDGAKAVGSSVVNGAVSGAQAVGRGVANVAGAAWDGAKSVGSAIGSGVSAAGSAIGGAAKKIFSGW